MRRYEITPILIAPSPLSQCRRSFVSNFESGLLLLLIIPKLRTEPLRGSAAVGRPEGTLRTTPQNPPTVIKRLRL